MGAVMIVILPPVLDPRLRIFQRHEVKSNQNAYIEQFNRTFLEEVLDQHLFAP